MNNELTHESTINLNNFELNDTKSDFMDANKYKKIFNVDVYQIVEYLKKIGYAFVQQLNDDRIDEFELIYGNKTYCIYGLCGYVDTFTISNNFTTKDVTVEEFFNALKIKLPENFVTFIPINEYLERKKEKENIWAEKFNKMSLTERLICAGQDIYWTDKPMVTNFKVVRRHTNFAANMIETDNGNMINVKI